MRPLRLFVSRTSFTPCLHSNFCATPGSSTYSEWSTTVSYATLLYATVLHVRQPVQAGLQSDGAAAAARQRRQGGEERESGGARQPRHARMTREKPVGEDNEASRAGWRRQYGRALLVAVVCAGSALRLSAAPSRALAWAHAVWSRSAHAAALTGLVLHRRRLPRGRLKVGRVAAGSPDRINSPRSTAWRERMSDRAV